MFHVHGHGHGHSHDHQHDARGGSAASRVANRRRLLLTLVLAATYMVAEFVGGWLTNSLALLADAGHMLSDVAALALSWFAIWIAERPADNRRTYGYYRAEILAALANASTLIAISLLIFYEAYRRMSEPPEVQGGLMMGIAAGGLVVNVLSLFILSGGRKENLNLHGAWLHVATDALGSIGAIVAGLLIWQFGWNWADPLTSVLIGLLVIHSSWRLLGESVSVLMESVPQGLDVDEVRRAMLGITDVIAVHDLHVWTITSGMPSLSAHVVTAKPELHSELLARVRHVLHDRFGIDHLTIQIEPEGFEEQGACC
jgi:cobalt-zinc-cadmium efflux system protein